MSSDESAESDSSSPFSYYSDGSDGDVQCCLAKSDSSSESDSFKVSPRDASLDYPPLSLSDEERKEIVRNSDNLPQDSYTTIPSAAGPHLENFSSLRNRFQLFNGSLISVCGSICSFLDNEMPKPLPGSLDVCVFRPTKPMMVLTYTEKRSPTAEQYNSNVARGIMKLINQQMTSNLTCVHGVIDEHDCKNDDLFSERVTELEDIAKKFLVPVTLKMDRKKCADAIKAFLTLIPKITEKSDSIADHRGGQLDSSDMAAKKYSDEDTTITKEISEEKTKYPSQLSLVLLGKTGSGKSSTGNCITGRESFVTRNFESPVTFSCQADTVQRFGLTLRVIDTPDLWNITAILPVLKSGVHAVLYVCRLGTFRDEESTILHHLAEYFGEQFSDFVTVIFTGPDDSTEYDNTEIETYLKQSPKGLQDLVLLCKGKYVALNTKEKYEDNTENIMHLLSVIKDTVIHDNRKSFKSLEKKQGTDIRGTLKWKHTQKLFQHYMERRHDIISLEDRLEKAKDEKIRTIANQLKYPDLLKVENELKSVMENSTLDDPQVGLADDRQAGEVTKEVIPENRGIPKKIRIVLIGKSGSGKSATGNTITGRQLFYSTLSDKAITQTCHEDTVERLGYTLTVVDTPGFWNLQRLPMILSGAHVVIFVCRMGQINEEDTAICRALEHVFGNTLSVHLIMVLSFKNNQLVKRPGAQLQSLLDFCENRHIPTDNRASDEEKTEFTKWLLYLAANVVAINRGNSFQAEIKKCLPFKIEHELQKLILSELKRNSEEFCETVTSSTDSVLADEGVIDFVRCRELLDWKQRQIIILERWIQYGGIVDIMDSETKAILQYEISKASNRRTGLEFEREKRSFIEYKEAFMNGMKKMEIEMMNEMERERNIWKDEKRRMTETIIQAERKNSFLEIRNKDYKRRLLEKDRFMNS